MLIKITEPGWAKFNGDLGTKQFVDGVSTEHLLNHEALALGAYISVIEIDEDGNELGPVSPGLNTIRAADVSATVEEPIVTLAQVRAAEADKAEAADIAAAAEPVVHTQETLEAIASDKGISGIREITDPMGIKGTSIRGLISEALLQAPKAE